MHEPLFPSLYPINQHVRLTKLSQKLGRPPAGVKTDEQSGLR